MKTGNAIPLWFTAVVPLAANIWVLAVLVELLLGMVLITGVGWGRGTRILSIAMFGALAAVALALTVRGESSCGCLGRVPLRPWGAALVDVSAIGLLLFAGSGKKSASVMTTKPLAARYHVIVAIGMLVLSVSAVIATHFRDPLVVPNPVSAEFAASGSWAPFHVTIRNRGNQPGLIYGVVAPNHVRVATVLPLVIEPGEKETVDFLLYCGGGGGVFATRFKLLTDVADQRELVIHVNGGVRK